MVELRTFGGLSIEANGAPTTGAAAQRKTLALLALLARHPRGLSRDKLIAYLWPETDAEHGRRLLRQACYALRRDLDAHDLFLGSTELRLHPAVVTSDVQAFEDALQRGDLARAIDLHAGPFLDGFYLSESNEFERWVQAERDRLAKQVCEALETLATRSATEGDHRAAQKWWRRLAALEPLNSRAALGLMTALAELGEVPEALQHGRAYEALVYQELGSPLEPPVSEILGRLLREPAAAEGVTAEDLRLAKASGGRRRTVGYERERAALRDGFQAAVAGRGLVVCVAGEAGSGKTTLVEDFLGEVVASGRTAHIARGRCSERLAGSGAYLPLLDALETLLCSDVRGVLGHLIKQLAPNWHAQVAPSLQQGASQGSLPQVQAASQDRLKRELNGFFREVCRLRPLIVFLDDVHWVDAATIDILGYVASQMGTAQMLIVATYRPSELQLARHPFRGLKLDLEASGSCRELPLELLTRDDIEQFLELEFPGHRFPPTFAGFVHAKTEGSPLFMVDLLRYLRAKRTIVTENAGWKLTGSIPDLERELPESTRSMIERKIEELPEGDRQLLVAAAVQGYEFDSPVVTKVLEADPSEVEERLEMLGPVDGFVRRLREHAFPDGTPAVRYRFVHVLYQNALYASLSPTRRASVSRLTAEALLTHYGAQSADVAAELGVLFETARDIPRAAEHFALAAERAAHVFAHREAAALAGRSLGLLRRLPDTPERAGRELGIQLRLGFSLGITKGYTHPESGACMRRAWEICRQLGDSSQLFPAIFGLWAYYVTSGEMRPAREMAEQLLRMAQAVRDPILLFGAHLAMGSSLQHMAELVPAVQHCERAMALYDRGRRDAYLALYQQDGSLYIQGEWCRALWLLGYPDGALRRMEQTFALAREVTDEQALAWPLIFAALLHLHLGNPEPSREYAERGFAHATEYGMEAHQRWGVIVRSWTLAELGAPEEGIAQMQESLAAHRASRQMIGFQYWLALFAEVLAKARRSNEGLAAVREGLEVVAATGQHFYEPELHRLKGELLLQRASTCADAEACFQNALAVAVRQRAKSLELRAALSLGRLWQQDGKKDQARALLAPVYSWFTEGLNTRDLQDAKKLLDALM